MSEQDDRLDQQVLSRLWELESAGEADQRAELAGGQYLSLFLDTDDGQSYVFRHGSAEANEDIEVGRESEVFAFPTAGNAHAAYEQMVNEASAEGSLVDPESDEELGDPAMEGPMTNEVGEENERDW